MHVNNTCYHISSTCHFQGKWYHTNYSFTFETASILIVYNEDTLIKCLSSKHTSIKQWFHLNIQLDKKSALDISELYVNMMKEFFFDYHCIMHHSWLSAPVLINAIKIRLRPPFNCPRVGSVSDFSKSHNPDQR